MRDRSRSEVRVGIEVNWNEPSCIGVLVKWNERNCTKVWYSGMNEIVYYDCLLILLLTSTLLVLTNFLFLRLQTVSFFFFSYLKLHYVSTVSQSLILQVHGTHSSVSNVYNLRSGVNKRIHLLLIRIPSTSRSLDF